MCQLACYPSSRCHLEPLLIDETQQKFDGQIRIYCVCEYFHLFFLSACPGFIIGQASNSHFYSEFF